MYQDHQKKQFIRASSPFIAQQNPSKGISFPAVIPVLRMKSGGDISNAHPLPYQKEPFQLHDDKAIQLKKITTSEGSWTAGGYELGRDSGDPLDLTGTRGANMELVFEPFKSVDAKQIILTQAVKTHKNNAPYILPKPNIENRTVKDGTGAGYRIDNDPYHISPAYHSSGLEGPSEKEGSRTIADTTFGHPKEELGQNEGMVRSGFAGYNYIEGGRLNTHNAALVDRPRLMNAKKNSGHTFETTALATEGKDAGTYYGSVRWGWETNNEGKHSLLDFEVISRGTPSGNFIESAKVWNEQSVKFTPEALESLDEERQINPLIFNSVEKLPEENTVLTNIKLPIPSLKSKQKSIIELIDLSERLMVLFPKVQKSQRKECLTMLSRIKTLILRYLETIKSLTDVISFMVKVAKINDFLIEHKK